MLYNSFTYFVIFNLLLQLAKAVVLPRHIDDRPFNIIWFMVEPFNSGSLNTDVSIKDLNYCRVVKPCTTKSEDPAPCEGENDDSDDSKRYAKVKKQNACDCKRVLEKNTKSFLDWVQNDKKMSTASIVVTLPQKPPIKNCPKKKLFKLPMNKEMTSMAYHKKGNRFTNKYKIKKSQKQRMRRDASILGFPVLELFNPEPKMIYNDLDRTDDDFNDRYLVNARNAVTILKDENEDVYEDLNNNIKNDVDAFDRKKVQSCPPKISEMFDLMKGKVVSDSPKANSDAFNLHQMVVNTMKQLISIENPHGYVLLIKGGRLEDVSDPKSPLARSIDYAKCETNENNTLIVLSMLCPEEKNVDEDGKTADNMLPVFCAGPHCNDLEEAEELVDLFGIIKRSLEESNSDNNCAERDRISSEKRLARALIETVYYDENNQEEMLKKKIKRSVDSVIAMKRNGNDRLEEGNFWTKLVATEVIFCYVMYL